MPKRVALWLATLSVGIGSFVFSAVLEYKEASAAEECFCIVYECAGRTCYGNIMVAGQCMRTDLNCDCPPCP